MIEKLKKELEEIEFKMFIIDMIDRWSSDDARQHSELNTRKIEIIKQLEELGEEVG